MSSRCVLPSNSAPADAIAAADVIRTVLGADMDVDGRLLRVTAGVGVAIRQMVGASSTLIGNADWALSRAKDAGIDQCRVYDRAMRAEAENRLVIQAGLRVALTGGELSVAYQPIVDLDRRVTVGSEALLRWNSPGSRGGGTGGLHPDRRAKRADHSDRTVGDDHRVWGCSTSPTRARHPALGEHLGASVDGWHVLGMARTRPRANHASADCADRRSD